MWSGERVVNSSSISIKPIVVRSMKMFTQLKSFHLPKSSPSRSAFPPRISPRWCHAVAFPPQLCSFSSRVPLKLWGDPMKYSILTDRRCSLHKLSEVEVSSWLVQRHWARCFVPVHRHPFVSKTGAVVTTCWNLNPLKTSVQALLFCELGGQIQLLDSGRICYHLGRLRVKMKTKSNPESKIVHFLIVLGSI